ncbi:hypothetical protein LRC484719_31200 [Mycobacterium riyadhense]
MVTVTSHPQFAFAQLKTSPSGSAIADPSLRCVVLGIPATLEPAPGGKVNNGCEEVSAMTHPGLTIGAAARAAGVTCKAVRVYEAKGLLPAATRTVNGYRRYDKRDVDLLTFVRRARALGLHLDDIRKILATRNDGIAPCATVRDLLDARIAELDNTVAELHALRETPVQTRDRAVRRAAQHHLWDHRGHRRLGVNPEAHRQAPELGTPHPSRIPRPASKSGRPARAS